MAVDPERLRKELLRMRELIASDPEVLAQFDTDGNGVIDGDEWEEVRKLVIRRLERDDFERELAEKLLQEEEIQEEPEVRGRDFSNLELAFDPRKSDASPADQIFERELAQRRHAPARHDVRLSEHGTLADCHELILEQTGGLKQMFERLFRREYLIKRPDGAEVGRIYQRENEFAQDLTNLNLFRHQNITFYIDDYVSNERFEMCRSASIGDNSIAVKNPRKRTIADTSWTLSFLRRKYEVRSVRDGVSYYVRRLILRPFTFEVLDPFEEPIGTMSRGWSGMGFITGGNLFHVDIQKDVSPDVMWGFLAAALLADLDSERGSRKAGLDIFNS